MMYLMTVLEKPDRDGHQYFFACRTAYKRRETVLWCFDKFGEPGARWSGQGNFWFRDEADAFEFRLRWC